MVPIATMYAVGWEAPATTAWRLMACLTRGQRRSRKCRWWLPAPASRAAPSARDVTLVRPHCLTLHPPATIAMWRRARKAPTRRTKIPTPVVRVTAAECASVLAYSSRRSRPSYRRHRQGRQRRGLNTKADTAIVRGRTQLSSRPRLRAMLIAIVGASTTTFAMATVSKVISCAPVEILYLHHTAAVSMRSPPAQVGVASQQNAT